ncbi:MAG: PfkB family carbohydrate kinase [Eubacteriales bacterium]|nr:PfkB family carbohydrate kinase [Eubacteriales bacterium]
MRLIGIGDNVCDVYFHLAEMFPGGQALNVAVFAKTLGAESAYMGVFGDDEAAEHNQKTLAELEVDCSHCRREHAANAFACVTLVNGERVFFASNLGGASKKYPLLLNDDDIAYIRQFSVAHTSNNSFFDGQIPVLYETGVPISYDFSDQWINDREWAEGLAKFCTFGFMSLPDQVAKDEILPCCEKMHACGCKYIVATNGSRGAYFYDGRNFWFQQSHLVPAIDTLGAGDSYAASFLVHFYNSTESDPEAMANDPLYYETAVKKGLEAAAECSSRVCLNTGAFNHGKKIIPEEYLNHKELVWRKGVKRNR